MSRLVALGAVAITILLAGCGSEHKPATSAARPTLDASTRLVDLEHTGREANLFSLFNEDQGVPRLVLLMSPT